MIHLEYKGERVLTTPMLAERYGSDAKVLSYNFNYNKSRYEEGKHYFVLVGEERKEFLMNYREIHDSSKHSKFIYLWTKKGSFLHAKSLNTDESWDAYNSLVDDYFDRVAKAESLSANNNLVQIPTELNIMGQLIEGFNQSFKVLTQMQQSIDDTNKKADEAARQAEEAKMKNKELEDEINDMRRGLVDVEIPLRTQFNDAVRKYARRHDLEWDEAYNNVYATLGKQNHVDFKKRLKNRQDNGEKIKMIDIIEELNLLVPAIRLAKTLAGVAS